MLVAIDNDTYIKCLGIVTGSLVKSEFRVVDGSSIVWF